MLSSSNCDEVNDKPIISPIFMEAWLLSDQSVVKIGHENCDTGLMKHNLVVR